MKPAIQLFVVILVLTLATVAYSAGPPGSLDVNVTNNVKTTETPVEPFQVTLKNVFSGGSSASFVVPSGKRLIIQAVNVSFSTLPTGPVGGIIVSLTTNLNRVINEFHVPLQITGVTHSVTDGDAWTGHMNGPFYADAGTFVSFDTNFGDTILVSDVASISGYLVSVP